ncbi:hypothetical protein ACSS6W_006213 [Trichoderma asperelloides]
MPRALWLNMSPCGGGRGSELSARVSPGTCSVQRLSYGQSGKHCGLTLVSSS